MPHLHLRILNSASLIVLGKIARKTVEYILCTGSDKKRQLFCLKLIEDSSLIINPTLWGQIYISFIFGAHIWWPALINLAPFFISLSCCFTDFVLEPKPIIMWMTMMMTTKISLWTTNQSIVGSNELWELHSQCSFSWWSCFFSLGIQQTTTRIMDSFIVDAMEFPDFIFFIQN